MMKLWAVHDFATRSCCDLDLQGSDPNVVRAYYTHCYLFTYKVRLALIVFKLSRTIDLSNYFLDGHHEILLASY